MIKSPEKYAGRTLERHLQLYDWKNEYDTFDRIIKTSTFDGICNSPFVSSRVSFKIVCVCSIKAWELLVLSFFISKSLNFYLNNLFF